MDGNASAGEGDQKDGFSKRFTRNGVLASFFTAIRELQRVLSYIRTVEAALGALRESDNHDRVELAVMLERYIEMDREIYRRVENALDVLQGSSERVEASQALDEGLPDLVKYGAVLLAQDARLATTRLGVLETIALQDGVDGGFIPAAVSAGQRNYRAGLHEDRKEFKEITRRANAALSMLAQPYVLLPEDAND